MKRSSMIVAMLTVWGCGPSYGGQDVKTPDELVEEQDKLAQEDEQRKKQRGTDDVVGDEATDSEKKRQFDKKQAKMELQRATRSAESCPGVVYEQEGKEHPRGATKVTITFQEDGTVKQASIPSPFDEKPVGECVLRAFKAVIVPPYVGGDQIVDWDVDLKDQPKAEAAEPAKKDAGKKK